MSTLKMNTPIPAGMTITDNREVYASREFSNRLSMPLKTRELATSNRVSRYRKGCKFQFNLKVNRAVKESKYGK